MIRILDTHSPLIGKIAKLTDFGVELEKEYQDLFGVGNYASAFHLHQYHSKDFGKYQLMLMFIDERPINRNGVVWYCLKEIGKYATGDYFWFTLNQLIICNEL